MQLHASAGHLTSQPASQPENESTNRCASVYLRLNMSLSLQALSLRFDDFINVQTHTRTPIRMRSMECS